MKIGLFGGTFDPPHNAHIALADAALRQLRLDELWFLVTPQNPWKQGTQLTADAHRLRMVQLSVQGHCGLKASDYEFHLDKPTYSYLTLRHLRNDYPEHEFTLVVGGDNWAKFHQWKNYDEILAHHPIAVYPRPNCDIDTHPSVAVLQPRLSVIDAPMMPVSSTEIRLLASNGKPFTDYVAPSVAQYITDNNLYHS